RHQTSALHTALSPNLSFHSPYRAHRDLRPSPTRRSSDLFFAYSPYVPFFTNINATPASYDHAGNKVDDSAYWLQKQLEVIVEPRDRKSTRLNSSHVSISYAVFCLKKKTRFGDNKDTHSAQ